MVTADIGVCQSTVGCILRKEGIQPFHVERVEILNTEDYQTSILHEMDTPDANEQSTLSCLRVIHSIAFSLEFMRRILQMRTNNPHYPAFVLSTPFFFP